MYCSFYTKYYSNNMPICMVYVYYLKCFKTVSLSTETRKITEKLVVMMKQINTPC